MWKLVFEQIIPESDVMRVGLHTQALSSRAPPALTSLSSSSTPNKNIPGLHLFTLLVVCFIFLQGNFVSGKNLSEIFGCGKGSQSFRALRMPVTLSPMLENQT